MSEVIPLRTPRSEQATLDLQQRFAAGEPEALGPLVAPHLDLIYTYALRLTRSSSDADDLMQDTLVRAMRKHHLYDATLPIRPWLLRIATNLWRSRQRSPLHRIFQALVGPFRSEAASPEEIVSGNESDAQVRRAMAELDPIYREALALFHLQGLTYAEMEAATGVSEAALKQRVRRGKAMLAEIVTTLYPGTDPTRTTDMSSE